MERPTHGPPFRPGRVAVGLIAGAALIQASHALLYAFGSIHWARRGLSAELIGVYWAIGVVVEIALFAWAGRLIADERRALGLVALGGAAAALRWLAMAFDPGAAATFALQMLHGVSFGATHLGTTLSLARLAPAGAQARAQGIAAACIGLAMAAATLASGPLYRAFETRGFAAMAILAIAGAAVIAVALRSARPLPP